jgi:nucleoside-diphosphate-sugar epimerase
VIPNGTKRHLIIEEIQVSTYALELGRAYTWFQGKRIVVTGAAGFIGTRLVEWLHALGAEIFAMDILQGRWPSEVHAITGDILTKSIQGLSETRIDVVFHLAAVTGVARTARDPVQTFAVNAVGTGNILELTQSAGIEVFCLLSSSEVYGEPQEVPIAEDSLLAPLSVYGWSKVCAEQLVKAHVAGHGVRGITIRPFNVYGPGQREDFVISRFLHRAMRGQALEIVGTGKQQRVFTYVDDLVRGLLLATASDDPGYHVYNLAGEQVTTICEVAEMVVATVGSEARSLHVDPSTLDRNPMAEVSVRIPSIGRASRELGFRPRVGLSDGLRLTHATLVHTLE